MAIRTQSDKSVIYHIPKCGGIYVKETIRRNGLPYGRCKEIPSGFWLKREHSIPHNIFPEHKVGFSFCFVRHPVTWYQSFWCYRAANKYLDLKFPADHLWNEDIEIFIENMLEQYPSGFVSNLYQCYVGRDGKKLDFVGKQENLVEDLIHALMMADEEFDEDAIRNARPRNVFASRRKYKNTVKISAELSSRICDTESWIMDTFYV